MRMTQRWTSLILVFVLLLTTLPLTVLADGSTNSNRKNSFPAGLARLAAGSRIYEAQSLTGDYLEAPRGGVVYARSQSQDKSAVQICVNTEEKLLTGWVQQAAVTLLTDEQVSAYDAETHSGENVREYKQHKLEALQVIASASAATQAPETTPPAVTATQAPASPQPVITPAPVIDGPADEGLTDEVFGQPAPETTVEPFDEPVMEPDEVETTESSFVEARALSAPANLAASHNRLGMLTLKWDGVQDADAYQVLYKASWESSYQLLAQVPGTSYSTDTLNPTVVYYFRVQAVELSSAGQVINQSPQSASIPYIVLGDAKLHDPRGKDTSTIRLTWIAVEGATHYDVMMSVHGADQWSIVRTDLVTDYCDIANLSFDETYDFRVIPKRKLSNGTVITGNSSRTIMVGSPMETPSFTSYTWTAAGLQLTWDEIPGASGYVIYRRAFSEPDVTNYTKLVVLDEPVTTYLDTTMEPGEVYYYFVYSYKYCEPEKWRCFSLKGSIGMGVWLQQPTGMQGTSTAENGIYLTWDNLTGASHYDVFITSASGTMPTGNGNGRVDTNSGYHSTATLGKAYYYRVRGVRIFSNGDISVGPWSAEYTYTLQQTQPVYRALLIGNTYPGQSDYLPGCDNDTAAMATMLRRMTATPYTTRISNNLTDSGMISAIRSTFANATANDVSLFFYSGHGANAVGSDFHGALVGVNHTYLAVARLKEELDKIPGKKIVIVDSCHSGAMIGKGDAEITTAELNAFNSQVISIFSTSAIEKEDLVTVEEGVEMFTRQPLKIARGENDLANPGYYVITASHSTENSVSVGTDQDQDGQTDKYFGLFTYALCRGSGWNMASDTVITTLEADRDSNNEITLYEAYVYAKAKALVTNPNQTAQIYPANSGFVVWAK